MPVGEALLYGGTVILAAGGLDVLVRASGSFATVRAALWAAVYGGFGALLLLYPATLVTAVRSGWPMLVVPALALLSLLWSSHPDATQRAAFQLITITLFGLLFGSRYGLTAILWTAFAGLTVTALLSALVAVGGGGLAYDHHGNLIGAFSHKNVLGNTMGLLLLLAAGLTRLAPSGLATGLVVLLAAAFILASGSATALLATLGSGALLVGYGVLRLPTAPRLFIVALGGLVAVLILAVLLAVPGDPVLLILDLLGRDPTLTGRSTLWAYATQLIGKHPWIGVGYQAFWAHHAASESAWLRWIVEQELYSFHNGYLEIQVELGILGALAVAATFFLYGWRALAFLVRDGRLVAAVPLLVLSLAAITNLAEVAIFVRHGLLMFLLAALFTRLGLDLTRTPGGRP